MPGPLPKHPSQRRRRNAAPGGMQLPAEGRIGPVPCWPLPTPTRAQRLLWVDLWRTPQAVAWERLGLTRQVARYVGVTVRAEQTMSAPLLAEARRLEECLGLTARSLIALRWEITEESPQVAGVTALADYRQMFADEKGKDE